MARVRRRLHAPSVRSGIIVLDSNQAHHARRVLRLREGSIVEIFDDDGGSAVGALRFDGLAGASVIVEDAPTQNAVAASPRIRLSVAAAVPKGERADWMVQKLTELGVAEFIPLMAERSVVLPGGPNKLARWSRIATEAAKQSRRVGSMRIGELTPMHNAILQFKERSGWYLSVAQGARAVREAADRLRGVTALVLFIGPEGGWTANEIRLLDDAGLAAVRLTETILRIETAAVAAASIAATCI